MGKLGSFLLGGIVGAGLALLFAPRSGEETRALVADKADEYWGKGQDIYGQGKARIAEVQPVIAQKGDELREKIDNARTLIADQVAKNAASAREVISEKVPAASEKINQAADVVRGHIDNAAAKVKEIATSRGGAKEDEVAATAGATADAAAAQPAVVVDKVADAVEGVVGSQKA